MHLHLCLLSAAAESFRRVFCAAMLHRLSVHVADGVSECSATLDDSVSEEEEGSFDELTDVTPYLQPGVELSVLNEVRLRREPCHVAALTKISSKNVLQVSDAVLISSPCRLVNSCAAMLMRVVPRCLASVQQEALPVRSPQAYT